MSYDRPVRLGDEKAEEAFDLIRSQARKDGFVMLPRLARSDISVYETIGEEPGEHGDVPIYFIFYQGSDGRYRRKKRFVGISPYGYINSAILEYLFNGLVEGPANMLIDLEERDSVLYKKWLREHDGKRFSLQLQTMIFLSKAAKRGMIRKNYTESEPLTYEMIDNQRERVMDLWGRR